MNDFVLVKINGNETFKNYVSIEKGKKSLYLQLTKALYGCMQSALLWYETFKDCLEEMGFKLNPYDPCVANKVIDGNQCTICWYVDDTKISHCDSKVVDSVISSIYNMSKLLHQKEKC